MAALVAVVIFVSIATFDWHSLRTIHRMPKSKTTCGKTATIVGLDEYSFDRFERHSGQLAGAH